MAEPTTESADDLFMQVAVSLGRLCSPVDTAFNVGAIVVRDGSVVSCGFSRELPGNTHAEECALMKVAPELVVGSTIYSTMEVRMARHDLGAKS